jgi:hypothetical protein
MACPAVFPEGAVSTRWMPPPNWPAPPAPGWEPAPGWQPDPSWGPAPEGWNFFPESASWPTRHKLLMVLGITAAVVLVAGAAVAALLIAVLSSSSTSTTSSHAAVPQAGTAIPSTHRVATLVSVPGYAYTALPAPLAPLPAAVRATGLASSVAANGVKADSGNGVELAIVSWQYRPQITTRLDREPVSKVLQGASTGIRATLGGTPRITKHELSGTQAWVLTKPPLTTAIMYERGGTLIEILGPANSNAVLRFAAAYLAAGG